MKMEKELVNDLNNGCTIFGLYEAKKVRELQKEHPDWVRIISVKDLKDIMKVDVVDEHGRLAYFGAILTDEGREHMEEMIGESNGMKCVLCGKEIEGYGNNALPLAEGQCCDECNVDVIVARMMNAEEGRGIYEHRTNYINHRVQKYINTVQGQAKYMITEIEDENGRWNDSYSTVGGFYVIHRGKEHDIYMVGDRE